MVWSGLVSVSVALFFVFVSISVSVSAHENRLRYNWGVLKTILIVGSSREEGRGGIFGVQTEMCRVRERGDSYTYSWFLIYVKCAL